MLPDKLPSDVRQNRVIKALKRAGFVISYQGGKGSHCKATDPKTRKFLIVQYDLKKGELKEILKAAEEFGHNAAEIMNYY